MPSPPISINVGGILCKVYNKPEALKTGLPIGVLIAAHGRGEDQDGMKSLVEGVLETCDREARGGVATRALVVVTFVSGGGSADGMDNTLNMDRLARINGIMGQG